MIEIQKGYDYMSKMYIYQNKKDKRYRYKRINDDGTITQGSYPRILMEESLGRPLEPNEDVHHIDGDVTNNSLDNLEVVLHGPHQREHSIKYIDTIENCMICGEAFTMTAKMWSRFYADLSRKIPTFRWLTCSKSCAGKAGSGAYVPLYDVNDRLYQVESYWK